MDRSMFQVFLAFPAVFKNWSKLQNFSFEKNKYNVIYTLLKAPILLRILKPILKN